MVFAADTGEIFDHPDLAMLVRRGEEFATPRPDELTPLPDESRLYLLPQRAAVGLDEATGELTAMEEHAVAAFVCPGYTATGLAAYTARDAAAPLPMFSYAAVGFLNDRFYVAAKQVDTDPRQVFARVNPKRIERGARELLRLFPENRLVKHLTGCALASGCPAARNLCLGRYEAPLPTARACNARCVGCLSLQPTDSGFPATQDRIAFTPTPSEIVEIMRHHDTRAETPIHSFGQGCEGEPLTEAARIAEAVRLYRSQGGEGTVNVNTNASLPEAVTTLAAAGLDSIRVSLNSARPALYHAYHRPAGYDFSHVEASMAAARAAGLWISLNVFYFPGVTDTEAEWDALADLVARHRVDFIQLRNLNLDPELYVNLVREALAEHGGTGPSMGLKHFRKRLKKHAPWLGFGYFNPAVRGNNA